MKQPILVLSDHVAYQSQSVVSKELHRKSTGSLTLFAFDQGQGLSEHTAPFDAIVQIVDGSAQITIGGELHHLQTGELVIMPAGIPHSLHAEVPFKMLLTMIREAQFQPVSK